MRVGAVWMKAMNSRGVKPQHLRAHKVGGEGSTGSGSRVATVTKVDVQVIVRPHVDAPGQRSGVSVPELAPPYRCAGFTLRLDPPLNFSA
jgi:hypothetical protein